MHLEITNESTAGGGMYRVVVEVAEIKTRGYPHSRQFLESEYTIAFDQCGHWSCGCCNFNYMCRDCNGPRVLGWYHHRGVIEVEG